MHVHKVGASPQSPSDRAGRVRTGKHRAEDRREPRICVFESAEPRHVETFPPELGHRRPELSHGRPELRDSSVFSTSTMGSAVVYGRRKSHGRKSR